MFGLFGNSTPRYQGLGTSPARKSGRVLGFITGLFGGAGTPTYGGGGQAARGSATGLGLFRGNPSYKQPPVEPAIAPVTAAAAPSEDNVVETAGTSRTTITIIVESDADAPEAEEVGELQRLQDRVLDD